MTAPPLAVRLYTTLGCHLCEQALALLHGLDTPQVTVQEVEISESETLMQRYGTRIPVIRPAGSTRELGWPFDQQALRRFLAPVARQETP